MLVVGAVLGLAIAASGCYDEAVAPPASSAVESSGFYSEPGSPPLAAESIKEIEFRGSGVREILVEANQVVEIASITSKFDGKNTEPFPTYGPRWFIAIAVADFEDLFLVKNCAVAPTGLRLKSFSFYPYDQANFNGTLQPGKWRLFSYAVNGGSVLVKFKGSGQLSIPVDSESEHLRELLRLEPKPVVEQGANGYTVTTSLDLPPANHSLIVSSFRVGGGPFLYPKLMTATIANDKKAACAEKKRDVFAVEFPTEYKLPITAIAAPGAYSWTGKFQASARASMNDNFFGNELQRFELVRGATAT